MECTLFNFKSYKSMTNVNVKLILCGLGLSSSFVVPNRFVVQYAQMKVDIHLVRVHSTDCHLLMI